MARSWPRTSRGFTFAETVVAAALMVVAAILATQLLFSSLSFSEKEGRGEKAVRDLLSLKTILLASTSRILLAPWADPVETFRQDGRVFKIGYWKGDPTLDATLQVDDAGALVWQTPDGRFVWGPWPSVDVEFWKVGGRVVGLVIQVPWAGSNLSFHFPWGSTPQ